MPVSRFTVVKMLYLYLVSFAALMMLVISSANIVSNVLKIVVFTKADNYYYSYAGPGCDSSSVVPGQKAPTVEECDKLAESNRKREDESRSARRQDSLVWSISMLVVALPLFLAHWKILKKQDAKLA